MRWMSHAIAAYYLPWEGIITACCVCVCVCVRSMSLCVTVFWVQTEMWLMFFFVNVNKVHWCLFHTESECVPVMVINYGTESVRDYRALCVPVMVSWGFGALLKGTSVVVLRVERDRWLFTPPTNNSCRHRDSNSQPLDYESDSNR